MPIPVPGFGAQGHKPTPTILNQHRILGVIPNQIRAFADREDNFNQQQGKANPPIDGDVPKFWGNVYSSRAPYVFKLARDENGNYLTRRLGSFKRTGYNASPGPDGINPKDLEYNWLNYMSHSALSVFDILQKSYPDVQAPLWKIEAIDYNEMGRISFPFEEIVDPVDYPIGEYYGANQHTFPGTCLILMANIDGGTYPAVYSVEEALKTFPVQWGPTPVGGGTGSGSGLNPDQVLAAITKLVNTSAARLTASSILKSGASTADKIAALLKL